MPKKFEGFTLPTKDIEKQGFNEVHRITKDVEYKGNAVSLA